jgi:hypothetical protein
MPIAVPSPVYDPSRVRWNGNVLGMLAYPMHARPAHPAWGVTPIDSGIHMRWAIDPMRAMPGDGFYLFRRPYLANRDTPGLHREMNLRNVATGPAPRLQFGVAGENRPVTFASSLPLTGRGEGGLEFPRAPVDVTITLPTSGREIIIMLTESTTPPLVRSTHGRRLISYDQRPTPGPFQLTLVDPADQLVIRAPGATMQRLAWQRVPGDIDQWSLLARIQPIGVAPLDSATIAGALGPTSLTPAETRTYLQQVIDSVRSGPVAPDLAWNASAGTSGIAIDAAMLTSVITARPQVAAAFGLYSVDQAPLSEAADYLVVGAWRPWGSRPAAGISSFLDLLTWVQSVGLLYLGPAYGIEEARAWTPAAASLQTFHDRATEVRRGLNASGQALLEIPLDMQWSLLGSGGAPLLARQLTTLADITLTLPGEAPDQHPASGTADAQGNLGLHEIAEIPLADLPGTATVSLTPVDPFGHVTPPAVTGSLSLPPSLYPLAPPPIVVSADLHPSAAAADLDVAWQWGGRLRLFHPNAQRFQLEWVEDNDLAAGVPTQQALRDPALTWRSLPAVPATPPRALVIQGAAAALSGITTDGVVYMPEAGASPLAGVRTDLQVAPGAAARLSGWTLTLRGASYPVEEHTVGSAVWLMFRLTAGAAGTPFANLPLDTPQALAIAWSLAPPGPLPAGTTLQAVSGVLAGLLGAGSLVTQGANVFSVLAVTGGTAVLESGAGPQEPGAPAPPRPQPNIGGAQFDAFTTATVPGIAVNPPTQAHSLRTIWVRLRTVDFLGRPGEPSPPLKATWSKVFPPVPAAGPVAARSSPPDAFGRCVIRMRFDPSLANTGYQLYRAGDGALALVWQRIKQRVQASPAAFSGIPAGFVWPAGLQAPVEVNDPIADFRATPASLQIFVNTIKVDEGNGPRPVFDDAFELRGRMARAADPSAFEAAADNDPMQLDDVVERASNLYLYRVRAIDRAAQLSPTSGVSLPVQGLDITPPAPPNLLPALLTQDLLAVRWAAHVDQRVTRYRVRVTGLWQGAPAPAVTEGPPATFSSPIRVEGDRVTLPAFTTPAGGRPALTSLTVIGNPAEQVGGGYVDPGAPTFVFWYAAGTPVLVEATGAGVSIRARVPASFGYGRPNGSAVDPTPLALNRGVLDGDGLGIAARTFSGISIGGVAASALGRWIDGPFLVCDSFQEGDEAVVELTGANAPGGMPVTHTYGRCPATPSLASLSVRQAAIEMSSAIASRLSAGDRISGLFRAVEVSMANQDGTPDPRGSGAVNLAPRARVFRPGFVRRLREGVPLVAAFTRGAGSSTRFVFHDAGGRPLRLLRGVITLAPWSAAETLTGLYESAQVTATGGSVTVPAGADNLSTHVVADARSARLTPALADGAPIVIQAGAASMSERYVPLVWRNATLNAPGLLADGALQLSALYQLTPDGHGGIQPDLAHNHLADVQSDASGLISVKAPFAPGSTVQVRYDGGAPLSTDPARLEWNRALGVNDVGRSWRIEVEALCDFPAPVGVVASAPASLEVLVSPPPAVALSLTSAAWNVSNALRVQFAGPAGLHYQVEAVSLTSGRVFLLADAPPLPDVTVAAAVDGTPLPLNEPLRVHVRARYPNASQTYLSPDQDVPAAIPPDPG